MKSRRRAGWSSHSGRASSSSFPLATWPRSPVGSAQARPPDPSVHLVHPRELGPKLPRDCLDGRIGHRTTWQGDRAKRLKESDLMVPGVGVEPTRPLRVPGC